ncbi:hypothetical protein AB0M10_21065 [Streptomyces sp. NPDC051840]|uniref:hypothetical protein n=1 Tax=unclassified Streptomyces TaxID=2593676 RepID=UPI00343685BE
MTVTAPSLLFLDVDGPLLPFGASPQQRPDGYPVYEAAHASVGAESNPLVTRIDPSYGPRLLTLPCELVWATTWMSDANDCVSPWLGLPELPLVDWPDPAPEEPPGLHWKTPGLVGWAAGRPFAWVDDEITDTDRAWVAAHHPPGLALLHHVEAWRGLTDADFDALDTWLRQTPG